MKLETTLEERPGLLHAMPVFDLFALATMLLLLGPMFLNQSGIGVDVPVSQFQMQRYEESITVTLGAGGSEPAIHLGRHPMTKDELGDNLKELRDGDGMSRALVLLKSDSSVSVGLEREVVEIILKAGFKVAYVGKAGGGSARGKETEGEKEAEP